MGRWRGKRHSRLVGGLRSASLEAKETREEGKARNRMSEIRDQAALPFGVRTEVGGIFIFLPQVTSRRDDPQVQRASNL